jgi:hypothetical protein
MTYISGLIFGIIFGFAMQRSGICFTGLVRDIYMLKYRYNILLFAMIIAVQGLIYYLLVFIGLIRMPSFLPPFSLLTIAIGSFAFGFGAVMSSGCLSATLIKCGDGRLTGWIYLAVYMASAYLFAAGPAIGFSKAARSIAVTDDMLAIRTSIVPLIVFAVAAVAMAIIMKVKGNTGDRKRNLTSLIIGILLGLAFLVSEQTGRHFGVAISTPIMSWIYAITKPIETCGGCNPYDEHIGWGSMLVLGMIIGSFISAKSSGSFKIIKPDKNELPKGIAGAALMGFGAMWGLGCLLGNGVVGTAQMSLKSWYALIFLVAGIWSSTRVFLIPMMRD